MSWFFFFFFFFFFFVFFFFFFVFFFVLFAFIKHHLLGYLITFTCLLFKETFNCDP